MTVLLSAVRRRASAPDVGTLTVQPTYEGSGKTIHPSVLDMGYSFGGYRWWMADTPYPDQNSDYENPSIWGSNDRINWEVPSGHTNPLVPDPGGDAFNFDTELVWDPDRNRMICYWRFSSYLKAATSPDGHAWTVLTNPVIPAIAGASEAIVREGPNLWRMWIMRPSVGVNLQIWTATDPLGTWTDQGPATLDIAANHGDIIQYEGVYVGVAYSTTSGPGPAYPIASTDGVTWVSGSAIPGLTVYRTTLLPSTEAGYLDAWYSTVTTQRVTYTRLAESLFLDLLQ